MISFDFIFDFYFLVYSLPLSYSFYAY